MQTSRLTSQRLTIEGTIAEVSRRFHQEGWTDGLPIIPPTPEAVEEMLSGANRDPQEVVALVPPRWAKATVEKIAINAVMAGCLSGYMPVLLAAVKAMCEPDFNLHGIQATTHPCGVLVIVNGPVRHKLDINSGPGAFGPCWQANATIGRAIRLILLNVGGAIPGATDYATQGQPSKFTYCVAENEEENPWEPLHVEKGFSRDTSTVTVVAAESPHNCHQNTAHTADGLLRHLAWALAYPLSNNSLYSVGEPILALCPEHASLLAGEGLTKADIKRRLFEHGRTPLSWYPDEAIAWRRGQLEDRGHPADLDVVPVAQHWEDIQVMVVGGPGKHSSIIFTFGLTRSVTEPVQEE